jgi:drug/metabolite transporter (DMT)-like permease
VPLLALVAVTAVWGVTFVQVKDAVAVYPLFLFLAVRFGIASLALGLPFGGRLALLDRRGIGGGALLGVFLAAGYALQTAGLERTTATSAGFVTGMFVPLTPVFAWLLFRDRVGPGGWLGTALATGGLALLAGVGVGALGADLLVLGGAAAFALHIVFTARLAPGRDVAALTLVQMLVCAVGFTAIALATEPLRAPSGWTVWGALLVTGLLASALGYAVQTWAQSRTTATRAALVITMEPVFAGLFGYLLAGDRLGARGWAGCAVILLGILVSEPSVLGLRLSRRAAVAPGEVGVARPRPWRSG